MKNEIEITKQVLKSSIDLDKIRSLAIIGQVDSGKTNLAFHYLNNYKGKRLRYLFGYPKEMQGFISISTWGDILRIKDGIIFVDELQRYIKHYETRSNTALMEFLSLMAHKNNTLIFTTQATQFITRGVESFIECWAIKRIDLETLKNGSKPKRVIQQLNSIKKNSWVLDLEQNEFYEFSDKNDIGENGIKQFAFQGIEKDWR